MKLINFWYSEGSWTLDPIALSQSNLLVGENSAGKSRTLEALKACADFIAQNGLAHTPFNMIGDIDCEMTFCDGDKTIKYAFRFSQSIVQSESFSVIISDNETQVVARDGETCIVKGMKLNPPTNKLILHVRRDKDAYPEFEEIIQWAENTQILSFAKLKEDAMHSMRSKSQGIADYVSKLSQQQKKNVIDNAARLNYKINNFNSVEIDGGAKIILFEEEGVGQLPFFSMSSGMFRTLYVLILLEYLANDTTPSMLLIDDLSEGLDYGRSIELGKLLFDYCSRHNIDLLVSSNDNFLMDVVPIDKWIILNREGTSVHNMSQQTHPELFEDFSFTGLNNFSLFSSDFISRYSSSKQG